MCVLPSLLAPPLGNERRNTLATFNRPALSCAYTCTHRRRRPRALSLSLSEKEGERGREKESSYLLLLLLLLSSPAVPRASSAHLHHPYSSDHLRDAPYIDIYIFRYVLLLLPRSLSAFLCGVHTHIHVYTAFLRPRARALSYRYIALIFTTATYISKGVVFLFSVFVDLSFAYASSIQIAGSPRTPST